MACQKMLSLPIIDVPCGGIAQLGERLHGMQEVSGSIPLISTKKSTEAVMEFQVPIV